MTFFRRNNTTVTLGKFLEAWITISLIETLVGISATMDAGNLVLKGKRDGLANKRIQPDLFIAQYHEVRHRAFQPGAHLM